MESLKDMLEFVNSYPLWAKLLAMGGLAITAATLVFAPRNARSASTSAGSDIIVLRIKEVDLFPGDSGASVKVTATVNNVDYKYPSVGGVEWLKVGPNMSPGVFQIPSATHYEIRFAMTFRKGTAQPRS